MEDSNKIDPKDFEGVNPMKQGTWHDDMVHYDFTVYWYLHMGEEEHNEGGKTIKGFNFDPFITDKDGNKIHYQRPLCWSLEDKQNFIESIYLGLNCGVCVLKMNNTKQMFESGAEFDVIDGKQRIHTLIEFYNNEFPDMHGNYYRDFSKVAKRFFGNLPAMDMWMLRENATDEKIKKAFLNVNFTGVPMSKEHIEFVQSINV